MLPIPRRVFLMVFSKLISFDRCSMYLLIFNLLLKRQIDRLAAAAAFVMSQTSNFLSYSIFAVVNVAVIVTCCFLVFVYLFVFAVFLSPLLLQLFLLLFIIFAVLLQLLFTAHVRERTGMQCSNRCDNSLPKVVPERTASS